MFPEFLTPPYGCWSARYVGTSLISTPPKSSSLAARSALLRSEVNTPAWRPKSAVAFFESMTS